MDWNYLFTSFDGRINRQPFWICGLILAVVNWIVSIMVALLFGHGILGSLLSFVVSIVLLYPSLALMAKRWHDRDKSGWWSLILLIPIVGGIWCLVECGFLRGTVGPNRFGPDPLMQPAGLAAAGPALRG